MSLFKAIIHKTKHRKAYGVSEEFMDVPPLYLIGVFQIIIAGFQMDYHLCVSDFGDYSYCL